MKVKTKTHSLPSGPGAAANETRLRRIKVLNDRAWELRDTDSRHAMDMAQHACALAAKCGCDQGTADALCSIGHVHVLRGEYREALRTAGQACALYAELANTRGQARALAVMGRAHQCQNDYADALHIHEQCLELARSMGDARLEAEATELVGDACVALGDDANAVSHFSASMALRERLGDQRGKASLLRKLAFRNRGDDPRSALDCIEESLAICSAIGDLGGQYKALNNLGLLYQASGDYAKALDCHKRSLLAIRQLGDVRNEATALGNIGIVYRKAGEYLLATDHFSKSHKTYSRIGDHDGVARMLNNIANVWYETANYTQALAYYSKARGILHNLDDRLSEALALRNMGDAHCQNGDCRQALECLRHCSALRREAGCDDDDAGLHNVMGDVHCTLGDFASADGHYRAALSLAERFNARREQADALLGLGTVLLRSGKAADAVGRLETALALAQSLHARKFIVRAHGLLADASEQAGQLPKSIHHLRAGQRIRDEMLREASDRILGSHMAGSEIDAARREAEDAKGRSDTLERVGAELDSLLKKKDSLLDQRARLMQTAAHDLRSPLAEISLCARLDDATPPSPSALMERLASIDTLARHALQTVANLLCLEAIEAGKLEIRPERISIAALAQEMVALYRDRARRKAIQIVACADRVDPEVLADREAVRHILDNLLLNAVKFTPGGGRIDVRVSTCNGAVRCAVADSGPGLSAGDKDMLFSEFGRLSARPTGGETSTGLGLWIAKQFVDRMGGSIWCDSEAGKGATFVVEFPCAEPLSTSGMTVTTAYPGEQ